MKRKLTDSVINVINSRSQTAGRSRRLDSASRTASVLGQQLNITCLNIFESRFWNSLLMGPTDITELLLTAAARCFSLWQHNFCAVIQLQEKVE